MLKEFSPQQNARKEILDFYGLAWLTCIWSDFFDSLRPFFKSREMPELNFGEKKIDVLWCFVQRCVFWKNTEILQNVTKHLLVVWTWWENMFSLCTRRFDELNLSKLCIPAEFRSSMESMESSALANQMVDGIPLRSLRETPGPQLKIWKTHPNCMALNLAPIIFRFSWA